MVPSIFKHIKLILLFKNMIKKKKYYNCYRFDLTKLTPAGSTKMGLSLLGNGYTVLKMKDGLTGLEAWAVTQVSRIFVRK